MSPALFGWFAQALLLTSLAAHLGRCRPAGQRLGIAAATLALACLPLPEIGSLAAWLHGILGAPSLTLLQLALLAGLGYHLPPPPRTWGLSLLALALAFYLAALGLGPVDPYGWGFQPRPLLAALLPLLVLLWRRHQGAWLALLAMDLGAWALGVYVNLWDALFDPVLVLILAITLAKRKPS